MRTIHGTLNSALAKLPSDSALSKLDKVQGEVEKLSTTIDVLSKSLNDNSKSKTSAEDQPATTWNAPIMSYSAALVNNRQKTDDIVQQNTNSKPAPNCTKPDQFKILCSTPSNTTLKNINPYNEQKKWNSQQRIIKVTMNQKLLRQACLKNKV